MIKHINQEQTPLRLFVIWLVSLLLMSCASNLVDDSTGIVLYSAKNIITVDNTFSQVKAVAVKGDEVVGTGSLTSLQKQFPSATLNQQFADKIIIPGLIDPHIHLLLGAMLYAKPLAAPWRTSSLNGMVDGYPNRESFLQRVADLWLQHQLDIDNVDKPLIVYGYHHLVHGELSRIDLDKIANDGSLIIWHYSAHDFYLNSYALDQLGAKPILAEKYHGIELFDSGEYKGQLTGRIYEDASEWILPLIARYILSPEVIAKGFNGLMNLLIENGVTSAAEMGYGLFGRQLEDSYINQLYSPELFPIQLYLVPEHRAFYREFNQQSVTNIQQMVEDTADANLPVLPQVKFFTDAAFYSQTMRFEDSNKKEQGLWVTKPKDMVAMLQPYWDAGLDLHIHSNGDLAQDSTLAAIEMLTQGSSNKEVTELPRTIIEHAGLVLPKHIEQASKLNVGISAASFYVYYLGEHYRERIGDKVEYITPLGSSLDAGIISSLHSDAPLAPPSPLYAASQHILRHTTQGTIVAANERLTAQQALASVTINAAWSLGLEDKIGSIEIGKRADFTILEQDPLQTNAQQWPEIKIWGVVKSGAVKPIDS